MFTQSKAMKFLSSRLSRVGVGLRLRRKRVAEVEANYRLIVDGHFLIDEWW